MSRQLRGQTRPLRPEELPAWIFRCGYAPEWVYEPAAHDWDRRIRDYVTAHAGHLIGPDGRYVKAFRDERLRRRWGRLPRDPAGWRHPDGRDGYGRPISEVLLPDGVAPLPPDPNPSPPPRAGLPDPRAVLRATVQIEGSSVPLDPLRRRSR